jgi:hypothetical protein
MATKFSKTISLTVEGLSEDDGHVRLRDFLKGLENLNKALSTTDRLISGEHHATMYYRIVGLSHSSPATVELEPVCTDPDIDFRQQTVAGFFTALDAIRREAPIPAWATSDLLRSVDKIAQPVGKVVRAVRICGGVGPAADIGFDKDFQRKVGGLLSLEDHALGSVEGRLDKINVHASANTFEVYPIVGPPSIVCHFPAQLERVAITSVKQWVTVFGELTYKALDKFPSKIEVSEIEVHPPVEVLPTLSDLKGVAPRATGKLKSETFVRRLRDAWE